MRRLKYIASSFWDFISGKRNISLYYATVNPLDALVALGFGLSVLLRIPLGRHGRDKFKKLVKDKFNTDHIYLYGSARSALCALLKSLEFKPGSEVLLTGFTCEAVPNAVMHAGLEPVYADIDPGSFCMSPVSVREKITEKTRVIVIQHTFGIPAEIDALLALAREHDLYVIEDCAVSLGSYYKGRLTGSFGDAALFSFELSKTITSCRGGMLLLNSNKLSAIDKHEHFYETVPEQSVPYSAQILFQLGLSGILYRPVIFNLGKFFISFLFKNGYFTKSTSDKEVKAEIPENYLIRLSDQQGEILSRQLKRLDRMRSRNSRILQYYYDHLSEIHDLIPYHPCSDGGSSNLIRYPILTNKRRILIDVFQSNGIDLGLWFTSPLSSPDVDHALFLYSKGECPEAERVSGLICNLPVSVRMKKKDLRTIIYRCLRSAYRNDK